MIPLAPGDPVATRCGDPPGPPPGPAIAVFGEDGRLSSRNDADRMLFGSVPAASAIPGRFENAAEADELTREIRESGAMTAALVCRTAEGSRLLRVSALRLPRADDDRQTGAPPAQAVVLSFELPRAEPAGATASGIAPDWMARLGHELRSPLNAVLGFAELIRQTARLGAGGGAPLDPARVVDHATDIVSAVWLLLRLADDLVALGETRDGVQLLRMGEVDLGRIVRRLIRLASPAAASAQVRIDDTGLPRGGEGPIVLGDEGALWSVVDNLLQNAIRYGGEEGTVRVAFRDPGPGGGIRLEIADDGEGLTPEELARALTPGGRTGVRPGHSGPGPRRPGGFGLPIARDLVEAHDGRLEIDTTPGTGFTARVLLPASRCLDL